MKRPLRWFDTISINIYWFALTTRAQVLTPLVLPLLIQQFVGEEAKGTYLGIARLWALMAALLLQALMGILSDNSTLPWGRRRPFILAGAIGESLILVIIGFTTGLSGMGGYWTIFALYILSMATANTAHAATQGLIPDLVPEEKRGIFSGIKTMLELPVPVIFVSFVVGKMVSQGNLWGGLIALIAVILVCAGIAMFIPETRLEKAPVKLNWKPFLQLVLMTAFFTLIILGAAEVVKWVVRPLLALDGTTALWLVGGFAVLMITLTSALGVYLSVRIGLGQENVRQNPSFTWWVINRLAFLIGANNVSGFMVYFLQERFPAYQGAKAAGPAAQIVMFVGLFILISALPSGWLSDRFGKKPLIALSGVLAALGIVVVILAPSLTVMYIGGCLVGAGFGLFYSANWALGTEIVPREQAGRFLGLSNLAGAGAGAIGAYLGGPIADQAGYPVLMAIYGSMFLLSIAALAFVKEKRLQKA